MVTGAQSGKTESFLDIIGERLDNRPAPILYVGPSKEFLTDQFEPRVVSLFEQAASLKSKVLGGINGKRQKRTLKRVNGVRLRLAHAGSSTALKSDPAAIALVDEYDEMLKNVKGQGDPLGLVEARGITYADFVTGITSTPSLGMVEIDRDPATGLEFWKAGEEDDVQSPIWRLWQEGTRHHWAWPCPHCAEYFIPRFNLLKWPKTATPAQARREAYIQCPRVDCGGVIEDKHKADLNARGRYIAPGQSIDSDGNVTGDPPDTSTLSFWVSGLASPFVTIGQRAETYLTALRSNESAKIQTATNAEFGEVYVDGSGDVPPWEDIYARRIGAKPPLIVPDEARYLTCGVDVQKARLVFVVRAWGGRATSWLIQHGELWGETAKPEVWEDLAQLLTSPIDGELIKLAFIDSGFRPGKKEGVPVNRVYEFCRRFGRFAFPTKGSSVALVRPLVKSKIEVDAQGDQKKYGLELIRLDTDHWKSFVHERLKWPKEQLGAWHVHADVTEDYCRQLVAEARIVLPTGKPQWIERSRENHYLDCFDPQTELLTRDGWKPVAEAVSYEGEFATVNLASDQIEYQVAIAAVARRHSGKMVAIKGRRIDALVTPNHRLVTYRRNPVDPVPRITLAGDLSVWHTIKLTASWTGRHLDNVTLPETRTSIPRRGGMFEVSRTINAGDWFEFLGWYVSEGHTRVKGRYRAVVLTQNPGPRQDRITALLRRIGLSYRVTGDRQIVITSTQVFDGVADCLLAGASRGAYRKRVPSIVKDASPALISRFVEAAILGDGWQQGKFRTYATTSHRLADDMQELFIKLGNSANVVSVNPPPCKIRGGTTPSAVQFHVSETKTKAASLRQSDNSPIFHSEPYDGPVYCVTVPNGTLIARRSGKAFIAGNCEAMAAAAGYMLNVQHLRGGQSPSADRGASAPTAAPTSAPALPPAAVVSAAVPKKNRFADLASRLNR